MSRLHKRKICANFMRSFSSAWYWVCVKSFEYSKVASWQKVFDANMFEAILTMFWAMFWDCQLAISLGLLEFKRHSNEMLPGCQRDTPQCWWVYPFHLEKTASNSHHVQILMFHVIHMSSIEDIARLCRLDPTATQWWYASCQVSHINLEAP